MKHVAVIGVRGENSTALEMKDVSSDIDNVDNHNHNQQYNSQYIDRTLSMASTVKRISRKRKGSQLKIFSKWRTSVLYFSQTERCPKKRFTDNVRKQRNNCSHEAQDVNEIWNTPYEEN